MWRDNWSSALRLHTVGVNFSFNPSFGQFFRALQSASAASFSLQTEQQPQNANVTARSERDKALRELAAAEAQAAVH